MPDVVADVTFELLQLHSEAILEGLPEKHELRAKIQTKLIAADVVRRYVQMVPPEKAKTDWSKLVPLLVPVVLLILAIISSLLGVDWKAALI